MIVACIWEWKCRTCGYVKETIAEAAGPCPQCGGHMGRRYSVNTPGPNSFFRPHFNWSLGRWVTSPRDFNDGLKRKGEEMSERLGIEHNYVPHEHGDRIGVSEED